MDIEKQVAYWRNGAVEDWEVAAHLLMRGNIRHGLFFVHLSVEKALKALVCRKTNDMAPKDHHLLRLAKKAGLALTEKQEDIFSETNTFNIQGRYADSSGLSLSPAKARAAAKRAEGVLQWLIAQL